jgi:hypothetical protein
MYNDGMRMGSSVQQIGNIKLAIILGEPPSPYFSSTGNS